MAARTRAKRLPASLPQAAKSVPTPPPPPAGKAHVEDDPEAARLAQAIDRLRHRRDPQGALDLLATFRGDFPEGVLTAEATLVRADALLRLGRRQDLLAELSESAIADLPRATELRLLRAEVLVQLGRCPEAIPALREVARSPSPALKGRADRALSACPDAESDPTPTPQRTVVRPREAR